MATYVEEVLVDSPLAYWRLGETSGTVAADRSTNGRNGTYGGNFTLNQTGAITGDSDPSVRFNCVTSGPTQVTVTNSPWLDLSGDFSLEFWIKLVADPTAFPGIFRRGSGTTNGKYLVFYNSSRQMNIQRDATSRFSANPVIPATASNVWTHYVITYDLASTTMKLFVNGAENVPVRNTAVTFNASVVNTDMTIGRGDSGTAGDHLIDEAAIYSTALPDARVLAHYNARATSATTSTYIATGAAVTATSGNVTAANPAGVTTGDAQVLMITALDNVDCTVAPSGGSGNAWTRKTAQNNGALRQEIWWKRRGAGDTDTGVTVTHTAGGKIIARQHLYRVPGVGDPFEAVGGPTNIAAASTGSFPSVTTVTNNAELFYALSYAEDFTVGPAISNPQGLAITEKDETEVP